jgi:predicted Zn-dependent protease
MGVDISAHAGFDPYGAERFLTSLGRNADLRAASPATTDPFMADFLSSHPSTPDRIKKVVAHARQYGAPGVGERDKADYLASIDGLVYGEDPNEGFVRGRRYLHPKLGFTFTAPPGFTLQNTAQAVLGMNKDGDQALRLDTVQVPAEQTLKQYLVSGWIENVDPKSLQDLTINGFPAAVATAGGEEWSFRLYAVRFGHEVYRFVFASKQRTAKSDRAFRKSVGSFRRMTAAEIKAVKPLRIRVETVKPGDTVKRLATRMAMADRPLQHFLVLNGLAPRQKLQPGDEVKIVTE